jgi:hypothetical protein
LRAIVYIGAVLLEPDAQQLGAAHLPPRFLQGGGFGRAVKFGPSRPEHRIARHRADQQIVQLLREPVALGFIHHDRKFRIVGR